MSVFAKKSSGIFTATFSEHIKLLGNAAKRSVVNKKNAKTRFSFFPQYNIQCIIKCIKKTTTRITSY
jgi:hypothetical protein